VKITERVKMMDINSLPKSVRELIRDSYTEAAEESMAVEEEVSFAREYEQLMDLADFSDCKPDETSTDKER